jgi:hypothetical protein
MSDENATLMVCMTPFDGWGRSLEVGRDCPEGAAPRERGCKLSGGVTGSRSGDDAGGAAGAGGGAAGRGSIS